MQFFLYKRLNRHNYTLINGHQGRPATLNVYDSYISQSDLWDIINYVYKMFTAGRYKLGKFEIRLFYKHFVYKENL